jgi:DNA-binding CsgD family transcriptional regulator
MLVGRVDEVTVIGQALTTVRNGMSSTLVLRGQAGIGKTALLDWTAEQAADMRVIRTSGAESEMDLGYATLHQLLMPFLDGLGQLPAPQRDALRSAFGLVAGPPPDRFLVGLATLTLITEPTASRPLLCLIDDAQWLDRVSVEVLGFVARRLFADPVGVVFAMRDGERQAAGLDGLPTVTVSSLAADAAGELLARTLESPVNQRVSDRVVTETAGNPLAVMEFAAELTEDELTGITPLHGPLRFGGRLEELYRSRVHALPKDAQRLLLLAAADELREPAKIWQAATYLGIDPDVAEVPAVERLVSLAPVIRFRHPLMRSAAYYAAPAAARRRAHEALAAASDPERDPDRRAWHLAAAARGPDEAVAAELERSAARARGRGGWASGAAFLERAAELTPQGARRALRLLTAAEMRLMSGDGAAAGTLLDQAAPHLGVPLAIAKARRLEGLTRYAAGQMPEATALLLDAARMTARSDARLTRDTLLDAFGAAQWSGPSTEATAEVLTAIEQAPRAAAARATTADLLLDGFAAVGERRYEDGFGLLRRAIAPLTGTEPLPDDVLQRFPAVLTAASLLLDWPARQALEQRWTEELRRRGALAAMLVALAYQAYNQLLEGRFADVEVTLAEGCALCDATGYRAHLGLFAAVELAVLAWRGREPGARALAADLLRDLAAHGDGIGAVNVRMALTWLEIGLGNYREALPGAVETYTYQTMAVLEVVEAATRCGDTDTAADALAAFAPQAAASGTDIALGIAALGQALLASGADGEDPGPHYELSLAHLRRCPLRPHLARAHLLYGEWLRRQRRRRDAREQLRAAWELFGSLGMDAFADRARAELRATGEQAGPRDVAASDTLTPQETQIARLAAEGLPNAEIAARLFISASTVDYHLRKVFRKLGISSRVRLSQELPVSAGRTNGSG